MMAVMLLAGTTATAIPAQASTITLMSGGNCGDYCTVTWQSEYYWEGYGPPPQYWDCTEGSWGAYIPSGLWEVVTWLVSMFSYYASCQA